ncbi:hypothetical protein K8R03_02165 [Candidatus Kaiserbacteria bacterium]|nr:hypothetical protein [Candidatus Kaiserbacteria bacterium]
MTDGAPHEYREHAGTCAECGNSPVNHFGAYIAHTLSVVSSKEGGTRGRLRTTLSRWGDWLQSWLDPFVYKVFAALPVTRFASEPKNAKTYRSQVIWEEAAQRGIPMEQMTLFGAHTEIYRARIRNDEWTYFQSIPVPPHLEYPAYDWIDDKFELKRVLHEAGIATPRIVSVTSLADAIAALPGFQGPVVVKPRAGSRGRHTTVNVRTESDVAKAFLCAKKLCRYVALEEYLVGSVCRGTVIDGTLAGFFQAFPPTVVGDGASTIRELIDKQNAAKHERLQDIVLTDEHSTFLLRSGYTADSVVEKGTVVPLTHRTGRLFGGKTRELLGQEHPKLREYLERAAQAVKAPVVGFDLIIGNPEVDPDAQKWGIIEANSLPYIDLHYLPLEGSPSPVAAAVWDLWK